MRRGVTLLELLTVCCFVGLVATIAIPRAASTLDALRVRQAGQEISGALALARAAAIRRETQTRVVLDRPAAEVRVETEDEILFRRRLGLLHQVSLTATRDTLLFASNGLGYGVANSTIVVRSGVKAETVTVSRLGRQRRSW